MLLYRNGWKDQRNAAKPFKFKKIGTGDYHSIDYVAKSSANQ